jgi:hypothetical protein
MRRTALALAAALTATAAQAQTSNQEAPHKPGENEQIAPPRADKPRRFNPAEHAVDRRLIVGPINQHTIPLRSYIGDR